MLHAGGVRDPRSRGPGAAPSLGSSFRVADQQLPTNSALYAAHVGVPFGRQLVGKPGMWYLDVDLFLRPVDAVQGLGPYAVQIQKVETDIKEMAKKVNDLCGKSRRVASKLQRAAR